MKILAHKVEVGDKVLNPQTGRYVKVQVKQWIMANTRIRFFNGKGQVVASVRFCDEIEYRGMG